MIVPISIASLIASKIRAASSGVLIAGLVFAPAKSVVGGDLDFCHAAIRSTQPGIQAISPLNSDPDLVYDPLKENNKNLFFDSVYQVYRTDVDNDGTPDNMAVTLQGTAHGVGFVIYDDQWKARSYESPDFPDDEEIRWAEFKYLARFNGEIYLVWYHNDGRLMSHVSKFEGNRHRFMCRVGYTPEAKTTTEMSTNPSLCRAILAGRVKYAVFDKPNRIAADQCHRSQRACAYAGSSALVDINNDGKRDNVVEMSVSFGGGRGCDFTFLVLANAAGDKILDSVSSRALRKATDKWDTCGGARSSVFIYRKHWYVENKHPPSNIFNYHNVVRLRGSEVDEICRFSVLRQPFVVE